MFKCDHCHRSSDPGEQPSRVVVETRGKVYGGNYDSRRDLMHKGGIGTEIVREVTVHADCAGAVAQRGAA